LTPSVQVGREICPHALERQGERQDVLEHVKAFRAQFRGVRDIPFFIFRLARIFA
jgi:hypothetical protein